MIKTLILCGGFGTRLGKITKNLPKPLIKINNISFLELLILKLKKQNIKKIFLSTFFLSNKFKEIKNIKIIKEPKKMGSGGAVIYCIDKIKAENILILNGDTISNIKFKKFLLSHKKSKKTLSILTTRKNSQNRYGGFIKSKGKIFFKKNNNVLDVDCGVYIINKKKFIKNKLPKKKCEVNFIINYLLEKNEINIFNQKKLKFIDIGIRNDLKLFKKKYHLYF